MTNNLISANFKHVSPQSVNEALDFMVRKMAAGSFQNEQSACAYNILCSANCLLNRYKTMFGEVLLTASIEEDDKKLRERILILSKIALHEDIEVVQINIDNT